MLDTTHGIAEPWPLATEARWRVLAWPDWKKWDDLGWILREFGPALAGAGACLCLRYDPEIDGPGDDVPARVRAALERQQVEALEVLLIDGPLSEEEWDRLGTAMSARVSRGTWAKSPRQQRLDRTRVLELRTPADVPRLLVDEPDVTPLDRFRAAFADVPGWFQIQSIAIWDSLLTAQTAYGIRGNFLEIGVWKGRSALLTTLHSAPEEECVFVDPLPLGEARRKLETVRRSGLHFVCGKSRSLVPGTLPGAAPPSYRWIHIDGEHTGLAVAHDLALAASLLGEGGIIVVDDFFAPAYPQITFAVLDHLRAHPKSLMMFLCGFNKGYLCHPADGRWLLEHVAENMAGDLRARGVDPFTIYKTTDPLDLNCFGIQPDRSAAPLRGPDFDQARIRY